MISSNAIPENIRRRMQPEERKELKAPTQSEADAKFIARAEKDLQENVGRLLDQRNIVFLRQRMDKRTTTRKGMPDFLFAIRGLACAVECKTQSGLTDEQQAVLSHLLENGWRVLICRTEDALLQFIRGVEQEAAIAEGRKLEQGVMRV